ncbi:MAG: alpha-ribazole phosphatase [Polaribacter sp.]
MEIIFIRHTTPKIKKGICYGQADIDVIASFSDEVAKISTKIMDIEPITVFYSSPLLRCKKLAQTLSSNIIFDNRLKELNFGDWELQPWNSINKKELNIWMQDFVNETVPNGESYINLHTRTVSFLSEISKKQPKKVVIVTHAGVMRSLYAFINRIPLEKSFDLKLTYGQVLKITYP